MPEPSAATTATLTTVGITLTSIFTNLDAAVLIGATSGASLFVIETKDISRPIRFLYFFISMTLGYIIGPNVLVEHLKEPALASFVFSACCIGLGTRLISGSKKININNWLRPR